MAKRIFSLIICIVMTISCFPFSVGASDYEPTPTANIIEYKTQETTLSSIDNADIININYSDVNEIVEYAKTWVDAGKTLCIVAPEVSAEQIATILNIPKIGTNVYSEALLYGYSIFKANDCYVFEGNYSTIASSDTDTYTADTEEITDFDSVITVNEYNNEYAKNPLDLNDVINWNAVISARAEVEQFNAEAIQTENSRTINTSAVPTATFSNTIDILNSSDDSVGYIRGTAYAYEIGRGYVNGEEGYMYVVAYDVKVYPNEKHKVKSYSAKMQYNIEGHRILNTTTLESNVSITQTLGFSGTLEGSLSLDNVGIGGGRGISYNISWTYTPESQVFTESSTDPKIITWTSTPVSPTKSSSYGMAPGAEVFVVPGYNGQRGLFLQVDATVQGGFFNTNKTGHLAMGGFF